MEIDVVNWPRNDSFADLMTMPASNIRRYDQPAEDTIFPLEYAFHLMGDFRGKTIVDLGCGNGLNTVVLAVLGARVLSVDTSERHLDITARRAYVNGVAARVQSLRWESAALPVGDSMADHVLCNGVFNEAQAVVTARQIRRVLKPGGSAIFEIPMTSAGLLDTIRNCRHGHARESNRPIRRPLSRAELESACRAVGIPGRRREFWLMTPLVSSRIGTFSPLAKWTQRLDAGILRRFEFTRRFAASLVWEARKES